MEYKTNVNQKTNYLHACRSLRGFTLVEILVVISIVAIIFGLGAKWALSGIQASKVNQTQASMGSLLAVVDLLKVQSPVPPDHRLANMYWIRVHTTSPPPPMTSTIGARQMSSMEFLVFDATVINSVATGSMIASQSRALQPSALIPGGAVVSGGVNLVDIYEQNSAVTNVLYKTQCSGYGPMGGYAPGAAQYSPVSGDGGYSLQSLFDSWGNEMVYREKTFSVDLNGSDPTDISNTTTGYTSRAQAEIIVQDEAVAAAKGMGSVLPATASYSHPMVFSPGQDGKWGAFIAVIPGTTNLRRDAASANKMSERNSDAQDNIYSVWKNQ